MVNPLLPVLGVVLVLLILLMGRRKIGESFKPKVYYDANFKPVQAPPPAPRPPAGGGSSSSSSFYSQPQQRPPQPQYQQPPQGNNGNGFYSGNVPQYQQPPQANNGNGFYSGNAPQYQQPPQVNNGNGFYSGNPQPPRPQVPGVDPRIDQRRQQFQQARTQMYQDRGYGFSDALMAAIREGEAIRNLSDPDPRPSMGAVPPGYRPQATFNPVLPFGPGAVRASDSLGAITGGGGGNIGAPCTGSCNGQCTTQCCINGACAPTEACFGTSTPQCGNVSAPQTMPPNNGGGSTGKSCSASTYAQCPETGCCYNGQCQANGNICFGVPKKPTPD